MPLLPGKKNIGRNIAEMEKAGHPREQSIAAALRVARQPRADGGKAVFHGGIHAAVPGRTDRLPIHVHSGAYVIPADIVSGLAEGNSIAGMKMLDALFGDHGPYGAKMRRAKGGSVEKERKPTPVIVAGGEYVIPPEVVEAIGGGDTDKGHEILDNFVESQRRKLVKTLQKLPGPAKN